MSRRAAVVGVGAMGAPMARRLLDVGFEVTVCDVTASALAPFIDQGVPAASRPGECADAEFIILMVATSEQAQEALAGVGGIASGLGGAPAPLVLAMGTMSKDAVVALVEVGRRSGITVLDAPVSGGVPRARTGALTIALGGETSDIERARPVLDALGENVYHCGAVGTAQVAKLVNNVVCAATLAVVGEAYVLGLENGLELEKLTQILDVSSGRNFLSGDVDQSAGYFQTWTSSPESYDNAMRTLRKDLQLALGMSGGAGDRLPGIEGLAAVYEGLGDETFRRWQIVAASRRPTVDTA